MSDEPVTGHGPGRPSLRLWRVVDTDPPGVPARVDLRLAGAAAGAWGATVVVGGAPEPYGRALVLLLGVASVALGLVVLQSRSTTVRGQGSAVLVVLAVAAVSGFCAEHRSETIRRHPLSSIVGERTGIAGTTKGFAHPTRGGGVAIAFTVETVGTGLRARAAPVETVLFARGEPWSSLPPGTQVSMSVEVVEPRRPGRPPALRALSTARVPAPARGPGAWAAAVRQRFVAVSARALPETSGALLPSLVLGDERSVPDRVREEFRASGLGHLSAVSGANVAYVVTGALLVGAVLGLRRRWRAVLAGSAVLGFVTVVGPEAAVLRAVGTGLIGVLSLATSRGRRPVSALCTVIVVVSLLDPDTASGPGFVLSVAATLGLIVGARPCAQCLRRRRVPGPLADVLSLCLVAHVCTLPVLAAVGLDSSPWALPANVAAAPAVPSITIVGTTAAALAPVWPAGAELLARLCGPSLWWVRTVAHVAAGLPGAPVAPP